MADQPDTTGDIARAVVAAACAAPSIHNTQPWRFRFDEDTRVFEVYSAPVHGLPRTDPDARAVHVSVGAALFNLRAAAVHFGREPVVRLLPDPETPDLLATVRLAGRPRAALTRRPDLYRAIWRRRTSRFPFTPEPVPAAVLAELAECAHQEGAELLRPGPAGRARLLGLTADAEHRNRNDPARRAESLLWIAGPDDRAGIPAYAAGTQDVGGRLPMREFVPGTGTGRPQVAYESEPRLLLLATRHDGRADWLRAGQALQHALLLLTLRGLRASLFHQAMEWPDLRARAAAALPHHCAPQMLLRVGHGPAGFPTPRRLPVPPVTRWSTLTPSVPEEAAV
ncbi:Acg family FMN-binding oxidoreductase [Kitasatospora sp. NPDC001683]